MNIDFQKALQYIDNESYPKAIECLNNAVMQEEDKNDLNTATQYRCVLGELYYQLEMKEQAHDELSQVIKYCDETNSLPAQRNIATTYINAMNGIMPPAPEAPKKSMKDISKSLPLVPKPVQDRNFITKKMNNKRG